MSLHLSLIKSPEGISSQRTNCIFDHSGGTLGRAENNTWVLPDYNKFLSSCHCEILFSDNKFLIIDRSTNGTFINGSPEPIGRGSHTMLADGDIIDLGDYRFSVSFETSTEKLSFNLDSPFESPLNNFASSPGTQHQSNNLDAFFYDTHGPLINKHNDSLSIWNSPTASQQLKIPVNATPSQFGELPNTDPFINEKLLDDFLGNPVHRTENQFIAVDQNPSLDQALHWPDSLQDNAIPEDWADNLLTSSAERIVTRASPLVKNVLPNQQISGLSESPSAPKERLSLAERLAALDAIKNSAAHYSLTSNNLISDTDHQEKNSTLADVTTKTKPSSRLIDALGLDKTRLNEADIAEIEDISGKILREIIDGMLGVLRSRANIKNEFRMNVTTIQPLENNPLKFSVNVDDALENIFLKNSKAFKRPAEAFREGFQEIAEHQLAMIAGIRAGFDSLMEGFNPSSLESSFTKKIRGSVLPGVKRSRYWSSYQSYYWELADNMDHSFQQLFGNEFVTAYEDQLRRLAASRPKEKTHEN